MHPQHPAPVRRRRRRRREAGNTEGEIEFEILNCIYLIGTMQFNMVPIQRTEESFVAIANFQLLSLVVLLHVSH